MFILGYPVRLNRKSDHRAVRFLLELLPWFEQCARDLPWRTTLDPYAIWISEVMLQQTQVKTVIPYWERWMGALPTIQSLAECPTDRVLKLWEGLGYYHRARNLREAARRIVREHGGEFPRTFEAVLRLPGVGRYTAGAICSIAFNQPTPVLDGNAIRVLARYFGVAGNPKTGETNRRLWAMAEALVRQAAAMTTNRASRHCAAFNQALMELGATTCTAGNPSCGQCPVRGGCFARRARRVEDLPELPRRPQAMRRHFVAVVVEHNGKLFLRRRPNGVVNGGLWEFPNAELSAGAQAGAFARGMVGEHVRHLCTIQHAITRYRMTLEAFLCHARMPLDLGRGKWLSPRQAVSLAFPSAHGQALEHALEVIHSKARRCTGTGRPGRKLST